MYYVDNAVFVDQRLQAQLVASQAQRPLMCRILQLLSSRCLIPWYHVMHYVILSVALSVCVSCHTWVIQQAQS